MEIWLVRHGETEWSKSGQHTGSTDLALTPHGEVQARAIGPSLWGHDFERVLCSPLTRARETARLAGFGDRLETTDLLRECDYGEYEGVTTEEIQRERPGWELFHDGCPGGESPQAIAARMNDLVDLLDMGSPNRGDVLVFGHGHALRALATRYLRLPIEDAGLLRLDAASVSILGHEHDHRAIELWNRVG